LREHGVLLHGREEARIGIEAARVPAQRRHQVEAEAVDVHLVHPVAQAVEDHLEHARVVRVDAVAAAREVVVVPGLVRHQVVVARVVDAPEAYGRAQVVALAGVVVDDVEDHLDADPVEGLHHRLEFVHLLPGRAQGVAGVGRKVADRVVAPVVGEAAIEELPRDEEVVHGKQLDGGDAEREQVVQHGVRDEAEIAAPELRRHRGVPGGHALHVTLVDDGARPGRARRPVVAPAEGVVHHDALRHAARAVGTALREVRAGVADAIGEQGVAPLDAAGHRLRVRVEEQLVRVEAMPLLGRPGPVHAVAVELPGAYVGQARVPDVVGALDELDPLGRLLGVRAVEEAELDPCGVAGEQREVHAFPVPGRTERIRRARPDPHASSAA
jgi:hypothetical protein